MRVTEEALHLRKIFMTITDQKNRSVTEAIGGGAVFALGFGLCDNVTGAYDEIRRKRRGENKDDYCWCLLIDNVFEYFVCFLYLWNYGFTN